MDYTDHICSNKLEATCNLHSLVLKYLSKEETKVTDKKFKKKIRDASNKFFIEDYNGIKTLRLKKQPAAKVHLNKATVLFSIFKL